MGAAGPFQVQEYQGVSLGIEIPMLQWVVDSEQWAMGSGGSAG